MQVLANLRPCLIRNKGLPGVALSPVKRPASLKLYAAKNARTMDYFWNPPDLKFNTAESLLEQKEKQKH